MNRKLITVAVAGALGAPAFAHAQASTVQVFGNLYYEYAWINQGKATATTDRVNVDMMQTPGSQIGFKGEEKLGGGLSAWFQCASTADIRGQNQEGWCSRNSAIGFKGSFGNVWVGVWDTPFKRVYGMNNIVNQSGAFGNSFLMMGGVTTLDDGGRSGVWARRQRNAINYDSPVFGGFQLSVATSSTNNATGNLSTTTANKPRLWSFAGTYRNGPLNLGAGYELHKDFNPTGASNRFSGTDKAYILSAGYVIGTLRLGAAWTQQKFEAAPGQDLRVKAWNLAADWKIAGPHGLRLAYTRADDTSGSYVGNIDGISRRVGNNGAGGTGAKLYQIHYVNTLSKRTSVSLGYSRLDNDRNAVYALGGVARPLAGEAQSAIGVGIRHRF